MADSVAFSDEPDDSDGKLDCADLVSMFEAAEESSQEARKQSERDRDYHDNLQLTSDELAVLKKRGQPPYIDNRIKTKIDYLVGLEKQQRINPRALPRTPLHEDDADSASQALNYVADKENFDYKRSAVWRNLLIEGAGGMAVAIEADTNGQPCIRLRRVPWDRMFWDPHSSEVDFSDAGYLGTVQWMDYADALALYPDGQDALDATMTSVSHSDTYDDKPKFSLWADKKRRRVRICAIWIKRDGDWHFAEFTKGGILKAGPSPYVDDEGRSDCELLFQSAYVTRDNDRFGLVRELISLQDAINKRNSKALHQLNTAQIVMTSTAINTAVNDIEKVRREAARPDGVIVINPTGGPVSDTFTFNTRTDLAQGQVELLQEAKQSIDLKGPNATAMGDKAQGSAAASGKAILASQQGGMVSLGDLLDNLRHLDLRTFRAIWNRIRQYWTAEKWIRVTDDEQNVRWVGINVDPRAVQAHLAQNPQMQGKIAGVVSSVAQLDCDIILDEVPDSVTPAIEQWQGLIDLKKMGVAIPDDEIISAAPNLKNKQRLLQKMRQPDPVKQASVRLEIEGKQADNTKTMSEAQLNMARAGSEGQGDGSNPGLAAAMEWRKALLDSLTTIMVARINAKSDTDSAALDAQIEAILGFAGLHNEQAMQVRDHAHQQAMARLNPPQAAAA